jgi:hypothetical protein
MRPRRRRRNEADGEKGDAKAPKRGPQALCWYGHLVGKEWIFMACLGEGRSVGEHG